MPMDIILITGMSGSGKSVALRALEDSGFVCVDNLPPELLADVVHLQTRQRNRLLAIAIDVRSAESLHLLPEQLKTLAREHLRVKTLFLDASTPTLVHRYSETRRRHPLAKHSTVDREQDLIEAIEQERELLGVLRDGSHVIDTSLLRSAQLQTWIKGLMDTPLAPMTVVFESFGFKRGVPMDADFVFDARMLPNPYYEPGLRELTGRDAPVQAFLQQAALVQKLQAHIASFVLDWVPLIEADHRPYVTIAIGCTGGQHRSVYLVEQLAAQMPSRWPTLRRHRDLP